MKLFRTPAIMLASVLFFSACGGGGGNDKKKEDEDQGGDSDKQEKKEKKVSTFNYKPKSTQVSITTYKHTSKTGVGIDFDSLMVSGVSSDVKNIPKLFKGAEFSIPISGLNSGDADRDDKIREHFFGTMEGTDSIEGSVVKMNMDGQKGSAVLNIKMNGKGQEVKMDLKRSDKELKMTGEIDAKNWDGMKAIEALQKACEEKHTGDDGKTKLWSTVALNISTVLEVKERMAS